MASVGGRACQREMPLEIRLLAVVQTNEITLKCLYVASTFVHLCRCLHFWRRLASRKNFT